MMHPLPLTLARPVLRWLLQASEDLLVEEGEVEAAMECRVTLAAALARQWFGVLLVPRNPQVCISEVWVQISCEQALGRWCYRFWCWWPAGVQK